MTQKQFNKSIIRLISTDVTASCVDGRLILVFYDSYPLICYNPNNRTLIVHKFLKQCFSDEGTSSLTIMRYFKSLFINLPEPVIIHFASTISV